MNVGNTPWLPPDALPWLEEVVRGKQVLEFGSGGSTVWLAQRAERVCSIEHHQGWYREVSAELRRRDVSPDKAFVVHIAADSEADSRYLGHQGSYSAYVKEGIKKAVEQLGVLEVVFVDGRARVACVLDAQARVGVGGWIVLDDAQRKRYDPAKVALRERGWVLTHLAQEPKRATEFWRFG